MPTSALRAVGAVLAAVGLLFGVVAATYAARVGGGTATFRLASPQGAVVVGPSVLARVDAPVTVTATAEKGSAWVGVASPSDASALVADAARTRLTGVDVPGWRAESTDEGSGPAVAPEVLQRADVWRVEETGSPTVSVTVRPDAPAGSVVAAAETGRLASVTVAWQHGRWAALAWGGVVTGLLLIAAGAVVLWRSRRPSRPEVAR
jgi:hypothetical protein